MVEKGADVPGREQGINGGAGEPGARVPEQARCGQIDVEDAPASVEEGISHRGEVEEVGIVIPGELECPLGGAQLPDLHLQLDAVGPQVEEEGAPTIRLGTLAECTHDLVELPLDLGLA